MNKFRVLNSVNDAIFYNKLFNNKLTSRDLYKKSLITLVDNSNYYSPNYKEFVKALIGVL